MAANSLTIATQLLDKLNMHRTAKPGSDEEDAVLAHVDMACGAPGFDEIPFRIWKDLQDAKTVEDSYRATVRILHWASAQSIELNFPHTHEQWWERHYKETETSPACAKCGKEMNPVEVLLGKICGDCAHKAHREVTG